MRRKRNKNAIVGTTHIDTFHVNVDKSQVEMAITKKTRFADRQIVKVVAVGGHNVINVC